MDTWNPYFTVGLFVFAAYVLLAIFGSRDRHAAAHGFDWSRLRRLLRASRGRRGDNERNS